MKRVPVVIDAVGIDVDRYRCEWRANGERCRYVGTISLSTLGSGPWYCADHALTHDQAKGAAIVQRSIAGVARDLSYTAEVLTDVARHKPPDYALPSEPAPPGTPIGLNNSKQKDPKAWARKLVALHAAGENVNAYALQCAREALGQAHNDDDRGRGPAAGDDDEAREQSGADRPDPAPS